MSGIWLDFHVFWATGALRVEPFVGKLIDYIRGGIFILLLNLPQSEMTANNLPWATVRILYYAYQPLKQGNKPEDKIKAMEMGVKASIWVAIVIALFRKGSPLASSELDATIEYISSRFPWAFWTYLAVVALWCMWPPFQWFLLRRWTFLCRIDHFLSPFKNGMIDLWASEGLYLLRKYRGHLLRIVVKCLEQLVKMALVTYSCAWLWKRCYGPLDDYWKHIIPLEGSWRDLIPLYRFVTFWMLIQLGLFYPRRTLRRWQIVDIIRNYEPEYEYEKLRAPRNIRLLLLHRRNPVDAINCTLFEVDSEAPPSYEAISYTWGDQLETDEIRVNGFRLRVPKSAYTALENRSSIWKPRLLWIDSICINQNDKKEKTSQIQLMKSIYSKAFFVSVCLQPPPIAGNDVAGSLQTSQFLEFMGISENGKNEVAKLSEPDLAADMIQELLWAFTKSSATELSMWLKYAGRNRQPKWLAFENLLRNDWFNRIWVVQEVALASSIRVFYSKTEIPWQHLIDVMGHCSNHPSLASLIGTTRNVAVRKLSPTGIANAQIMAHFRRKIMESESRSIPFSEILYNCDHFKATDPKDIIFGIQGLCKVESQQLLSQNYDKSEAKVYIDAAVYLLRQETPLRLLSYAGLGKFPQPSKIKNLPSWCPDWSRIPRFAQLSYGNSKVDYRAWEDDTIEAPSVGNEPSPSLILQGRVIDTIISVGSIFSLPMADAADNWSVGGFTILYQTTLSSYQLLSQTTPWQNQPYPYISPPQPLEEVFWRSLIGDRTEKSRPAPASCADGHKRWLNVQAEFNSDDWMRRTLTPEMQNMVGPEPEFAPLVPRCAIGRRICVTEMGYIGFVPAGAGEGDEVCLIRGAQVPFVVRSRAGEAASIGTKACILVGEAYLHGVMDGVISGRDERELVTQSFQIF
jgi:hypothetical protein